MKNSDKSPDNRGRISVSLMGAPVTGIFVEYFKGVGYFIKGFAFLKRNPVFLKYLLLPFCLSGLLYTLMCVTFFYYNSALVSYLLPGYEDSFFFSIIWYILFWVVNVFVLIVMLLTAALVTNIIASPFYDYVSLRIEALRVPEGRADVTGTGDDRFLSASWKIYLLVIEELKKSLLIAVLPSLILFIPFVGPPLASMLLTVFIAWEYIDYPLSRKRVTLRARLSFILRKKMYFLGFGTPLMVPVLNFFLFPVAIVGATLLYLDCLEGQENV